MIKFVCFASEGFVDAQRVVSSSALQYGADEVSCWSRGDVIKTDFYRAHSALLDIKRGAGYWIWKPFIILEELQSMRSGDVLIYSDTGRDAAPYRIDSPLQILVDWCVGEVGGMLPGVYVPEWGENRLWTKGECFQVMGCDAPQYRRHPQIQATFSVWQCHARSVEFVTEWLRWCTVPAAIADERIWPEVLNDADFIDHRHDQSVLTLLALREGLRCYGQPDQPTPVNKQLSSLVDRIANRTWSMRRRIAREDFLLRTQHPLGGALIRPIRLAKRFATSWAKAILTYP